MTQKGLVPDVTVMGWRENEVGNLVGEVRWTAAPGAMFRLELDHDGGLVEWQARADEGKSLSARQLRAAPVGAMERAIRQDVATTLGPLVQVYKGGGISLKFGDGEVVEVPLDTTNRPAWEGVAAWLADFGDRPRTGPAGRSDRSYAALSSLYLKAVDEGEERPVRAVADALGLAEKTVSNYLFKARERGLLTSRGRGKAGGHLTDKAKEILSGNHQAS